MAAAQTNVMPRLTSLDVLRGAVMVLMAIDHVRVYSGQPAGGPTAAIFFTRWVTHFCTPVFVFLAGTGAFLRGHALGDMGRLSRFLITRGLMLVVLELTVIRFSWTFNFHYSEFALAGVIWMLGWCMVCLAGLVRLSTRALAISGIGMILFQPVFGLVPQVVPAAVREPFGWFWGFIYPSNLEPMPGISVLYVLVPWIGVMAVGYAFGAVMLRDPESRRRFCLRVGLGAMALFLLVSGVMVLTEGAAPSAPPALFRLLNQRKYPASPQFLLMTLGPAIACIPLLEGARGWPVKVLTTFGRVPMFFYLLHIPLIHVAALVVNHLRDGAFHLEWYATAPYASVPPTARWSLSLLYLVFAVVVALLYVACRWFEGVKSRRRGSWLSYI
jgi:uncharacterized membrane protein